MQSEVRDRYLRAEQTRKLRLQINFYRNLSSENSAPLALKRRQLRLADELVRGEWLARGCPRQAAAIRASTRI